MTNKVVFLGLSMVLCSCCILMIVSISTSHWINTKMNFTTDNISIIESYQGLFESCQDMIIKKVKKSSCTKYSEIKVDAPAYRKAVQALLVVDVVGTLITIILSFVLPFCLKNKSVTYLFLLTFFQVVPVFCGFVALSIFTSKNEESIGPKYDSPIFLSSAFGYSFICGWLSCTFGAIGFLVSAISSLYSYRKEHQQFIARFEKLDNA